MKKNYFLHPLLFAILPVLILYAHNVREAWPVLMARPVVYVLLFALASWLVSLAVFRNKEKASIMTSVWLIAFFSYGHSFLFAANHGVFQLIPLGPHLLLIGCYGVVLVGTLIGLLLVKKPVEIVTAFLNVAAVTLLLINLLPLVPFEVKRMIALQNLKNYMAQQHIKDAEYQNTDTATYPDIYYVVFDRYPNQTIASTYFDFDNTEFLDSLRTKNFLIADQSIANYPTTFLSLSSSLSMSHLTFLKDVLGPTYSDQSVLYKELLDDTEVAEFLTEKGYTYYQLGSSWEPTKASSLAQANFNLFLDLNEFESFLYENTLLNAVMGKINGSQLFTGVKLLEMKAANVLFKTEKLKELAAEPGPKFIFAHYLLPHPPYISAADCQQLSFEEVRRRTEDLGYIDQTKCANKIMTELTEVIQKTTDRPVVIIFQSDEGPFLPAQYFNDTKYIDTPGKDAYKIHGRILNAFYLTDKNSPVTPADYASIGITQVETPVNTFRLLFNYYFGTNYPVLEDRSYIFTDSQRPYDFTEITDWVK